MSEEEEYFDSIDDTEFEECRSFCNDKFQDGDSDNDEDDGAAKISELIPFYDRNVGKSEIESIKSNSMTTFKNVKLRRMAPKICLADQRRNRSYLTMFYARMGQQPGRSSPTDTGRATCTETTRKSNSSCRQEEEHFNDEGLYDRFLEPKTSTVSTSADNQSTATELIYNYDLNSTLDTKIFSVSEAHFNSLAASRNDPKRPMLRSKQSLSKPLNVTGLGGLGPNIPQEKLEQLRKRQDYGKTVSEKNRIKMLENKVVRQLKHEIRESQKLSENV